MPTDEDKEYGVCVCTRLYKVDYYSAIKKKAAICSNMDFKGIMLRKSDKYCRISWNFKNITSNTTKNQTHRYKVKNWLLVGSGEGRTIQEQRIKGHKL